MTQVKHVNEHRLENKKKLAIEIKTCHIQNYTMNVVFWQWFSDNNYLYLDGLVIEMIYRILQCKMFVPKIRVF